MITPFENDRSMFHIKRKCERDQGLVHAYPLSVVFMNVGYTACRIRLTWRLVTRRLTETLARIHQGRLALGYLSSGYTSSTAG